MKFVNGDLDLHLQGQMIRYVFVAGNDSITVVETLLKLVQG